MRVDSHHKQRCPATWVRMLAFGLLLGAAGLARAEKPEVTIELDAVDENGEVTPASPVQGTTFLSDQYPALTMAVYYSKGANQPCVLEGPWARMPEDNKIFGDGTEEGLVYLESPKSPLEVTFTVSCSNDEGTTTATKSWKFLAEPEAPDGDTAFNLKEYASVFPGTAPQKGISIDYAIPGLGSACIIWRERQSAGDWTPVDTDSEFALYSLSKQEGISGSISYAAPATATYPYKERFLYSCMNPVLGFYADAQLIGTVTYTRPEKARETVVSIEMAPKESIN